LDTLLGTDPELFVVNEKNECIPPAALRDDLGFSYNKILLEGDNFTIVEDGAASEININPTDDIPTFIRRVDRAFTKFKSFVKSNFDGLDVVALPTVNFNSKFYWEDRGDEFKNCVRFGCDPDLDVRTGEYCEEISVENYDKRHGGGHIHISAPKNDNDFFADNFYYTTLMLDAFVGNTCVALDRNSSLIDKLERERLVYYGRPSRIRLPVYDNEMKGIEYRSPSNFWVQNAKHSEILLLMANCVFNLMQKNQDASEFLRDNILISQPPVNILNYDKKSAKNTLEIVVNRLLSYKYLSYDQASLVLSSA